MSPRDIPNILCILRMLLTVPVAWMILAGNYAGALLLFFVAGFTDGLDGFLAKRYGWQTELGGLLDPIADKLLMFSAFVTLWVVGAVPLWLLAAVVGRDLVIVAGAITYRARRGPFEASPTRISKANSALQLLFVLVTLLRLATGVPAAIVPGLLSWCVLATTLASGADYVLSWTRRFRAAGR